ncbi:MAG: hypothetical protein V1668_00845 [Patescibacteria group bacterium]
MIKKKISDGVAHKMPGDLKKAIVADKAALRLWEAIMPLARNECLPAC